jgi:hypothetical protein
MMGINRMGDGYCFHGVPVSDVGVDPSALWWAISTKVNMLQRFNEFR